MVSSQVDSERSLTSGVLVMNPSACKDFVRKVALFKTRSRLFVYLR